MAQVPIYNQNQVGVSNTPQQYLQTQNPNVPAKAFGDNSWADDTARALDVVNRVFQKAEDKAIMTQITDNSNILDQWELDKLHDPNNGYLNVKGKDAIGKTPELLKSYDDLYKEIEKNINLISDPYSKIKMQDIYESKRRNIYQKVAGHESQQKTVWQQNVIKTGINQKTQLAVANRYDQNKVDTYIKDIGTIIKTNTNLTDPELIDVQIKEAVSDTHIAVINGMLGDNFAGVEAYFNENKENINPLQAAGIKEKVQKSEYNRVLNDAAVNPDAALAKIQSGEYGLKDEKQKNELLSDIQSMKSNKDRLAEIEKIKIQNNNEIIGLDLVNDESKNYEEKMLWINKQDLLGNITNDFAADARRLLTAKYELNNIDNSNVMADIVLRINDLNAIAETNSEGFLVGINNIKNEILKKQADGKINAKDAQKLNNSLRTLTSANIAETTQMIKYSLGSGLEVIEKTLPPEQQGEAIRQLFYATYDEDSPTEKEQRKLYYQNKAREIIDTMKKKARDEAQNSIKNINQTKNNASADYEAILRKHGYTMADLKETAKKYNMTEQQVINKLVGR